MMRSRPPAWLLALSVGGLVAAGCSRPNVGSVRDSLSAEPGPQSAGEADKTADTDKGGDVPAYHFPDDAGGTLLAKVLPPADVKGPLNDPAAGPRRPAGLDAPPPALPLPPTPPSPLPPPGEHNRKNPAPHLATDETLGLGLGDPQPPAPRSLYAGDRPRLPSMDVNQPTPLPILAPQPTQDRAALDDPTVDASAAAALAAPMPQRTKAAPYVRITLPDPFDNRRPLQLPVPPDDDNPRTATVRPPKP